MNTIECRKCDYSCCEKTNKFIMNLQKEYNDLEKEHENLNTAYDKLNDSYHYMTNVANKLSIEKYDLEKQNQAWKEWTKNKDRDFDYKLEQYVKEINRMREDKNKLKEEIFRLQKKCNKLKEENEQLEGRNVILNISEKQLCIQVDNLEKENKKLKEENNHDVICILIQ